MNRTEAYDCLVRMRELWPDPPMKHDASEARITAFKKLDYDTLSKVIDNLKDSHDFMPSIASIKLACEASQTPSEFVPTPHHEDGWVQNTSLMKQQIAEAKGRLGQ
jgi:hypothetical protein